MKKTAMLAAAAIAAAALIFAAAHAASGKGAGEGMDGILYGSEYMGAAEAQGALREAAGAPAENGGGGEALYKPAPGSVELKAFKGAAEGGGERVYMFLADGAVTLITVAGGEWESVSQGEYSISGGEISFAFTDFATGGTFGEETLPFDYSGGALTIGGAVYEEAPITDYFLEGY